VGSVELPERGAVQRKTELVVRLLRGELLDAVSRDSRIPDHDLESWKRVFLDTDTRGLKTRAEPEERELTLARAKGPPQNGALGIPATVRGNNAVKRACIGGRWPRRSMSQAVYSGG
jgi:hypothetical protein